MRQETTCSVPLFLHFPDPIFLTTDVRFPVENSPCPRQIDALQFVFTVPVYVVRVNIDTDQIIPSLYLNLVPTMPVEYEKLGSYPLCGLPESLYPVRFVKDGQLDSEYPIVVGGRNFGCGSSREHAPIALGSANSKLVLAESFARIFFRNCVATGEPHLRMPRSAV